MKNKKLIIGILIILVVLIILTLSNEGYRKGWLKGYEKGKEDLKEYRDNEVQSCGEALKSSEDSYKWALDSINIYQEELKQEREKIYEGFEIKKLTVEPRRERSAYLWGNEITIDRDPITGYREDCNIIGIKISEDFLKKRWVINSFGDNSIDIENEYNGEPLEVEFLCAKEETKNELECPAKCNEDYTCLQIYDINNEIKGFQCVPIMVDD